MNAENVQKVIAALRSGEHKQGTQALESRSYQAFDRCGKTELLRCCLGVACRAAIADGVPIEVCVMGTGTSFDGRIGDLPLAASQWLGLGEDRNPMLIVPQSVRDECYERNLPEWTTATDLNDTYALTFRQIADCFEATLNFESTIAEEEYER